MVAIVRIEDHEWLDTFDPKHWKVKDGAPEDARKRLQGAINAVEAENKRVAKKYGLKEP